MLFCPKCGAIMMPKQDKGKIMLVCGCGHRADAKGAVISEKCNEKQECFEAVEKFETRPVVEEECPKCKNKKAYSWEKQMRAGDEPPTRFYECTKCKHTWREYS